MGTAVMTHEETIREASRETSIEEFEWFINQPENRYKTFELIKGRIVLLCGNDSTNDEGDDAGMGTSALAYEEPIPEVTHEEFEEFIALPENQDKTFELINGCIVMMAGNTSFNHQRICGHISSEIHHYLKGKKCEVVQDVNVYLFSEAKGKCKSIFQPDIMVGCDKEKMTAKGYEGTPEFVVEVVSKSSSKNDYFTKCELYMEYGVDEYWIVDQSANQILVYMNGRENSPVVYRYTFADVVRIGVFEDLCIDFNEIAGILD